MRIFVTVGSSLDPFDRLLRMVDEALPSRGVHGTCQHGVSAVHPRGLEARVSLSKREFDEELRTSDVVICHAGVGTLWSAIEAGHVPLVIPRRADQREIVNDHQLEICRALKKRDRIVVVESAEELREQINRPTRRLASGTLSSSSSRMAHVGRALEALGNSRGPKRWGSALHFLAVLGPPLERMRQRY